MREPYTQLFCHVVWATWDRLPLIDVGVEARLYGVICGKLEELKCVAIATGGMEDHAHVLYRFPASAAISYVVQQIKGSSSHFMNHVMRREEPFKWQGSYGAFTVSKDGLGDVREYILGQKEHHRTGDIWADWERTWISDDSVEGAGDSE